MRWLVALLGAAALVAGAWVSLLLTRRAELRIALNLRPGDPDDAALAAGVDLALEEREFGAGRYRLKAAHQTVQPNAWSPSRPDPCAHTMLYGLDSPATLPVEGDGRAFLGVNALLEEQVIRGWMQHRSLERLEQVAWWTFNMPRSGIQRRLPEEDPDPPDEVTEWIREKRPDLIRISSVGGISLLHDIRKAGFGGPVFMNGNIVSGKDLPSLTGCRVILAPLAPPSDFLRLHTHPFAYVGYRGMLRYLDALDSSPDADFAALARESGHPPTIDLLLGEPRIFVVRDGRLVSD